MSESEEGADASFTTDAVSPITRLREFWAGTSDRMESAGEYVHDAVEKPVRGFYGALHKSPGAVIVILLLPVLRRAAAKEPTYRRPDPTPAAVIVVLLLLGARFLEPCLLRPAANAPFV